MPEVSFTRKLQRHLSAPPAIVHGGTVREVLDAVFQTNPGLRGFVVDDRGRLRKHIVVFVDGTMIEDRVRLSDPIDATSELYVMQAVS